MELKEKQFKAVCLVQYLCKLQNKRSSVPFESIKTIFSFKPNLTKFLHFRCGQILQLVIFKIVGKRSILNDIIDPGVRDPGVREEGAIIVETCREIRDLK